MLSPTLRLLTTMSCLTLAIGVQAFAEPQLEQPSTIAAGSAPVVERDLNVTPAGCADSCCGGSCCGGETASDKAVCCPRRVTEDVKKHCWKVKSEVVCIPGFRFECNWKKRCKNKCGCDCGDSCCSSGSCCDCPPTCGRVRCIKVLEKHETTCEKCGYEWEVKCIGSGNGGCCCPSCGCASVEAEASSDIQLTAATETDSIDEAIENDKPSLARRLMLWLK